MNKRAVAGLRYCGGCNPRFDRVAAVECLRAHLPEVELRPAGPGQRAVLVVCGCPARCAGVQELDPEALVYVTGEADLPPAAERLKRLLFGAQSGG